MYRRTTPRGRENLPSKSGGQHNRELAYYYRSQDQGTAYGVLGQIDKWTRLCSAGEICVCVSVCVWLDLDYIMELVSEAFAMFLVCIIQLF